MSTSAVRANSTDENFFRMEKQKLMSSYLGSGKKTPLKPIQPTAGHQNGSPKSIPLKKMIHKSDKTFKVFEDKRRMFQEMWTQTDKKQSLETGTQTEASCDLGVEQAIPQSHNDSGIDQEAYDLMVKDPIPESYWKELAEERRLSLAEALSENEMLHQSMEELKEENLNLSQMASQAEYLASVVNSLIGEEKTEETEKCSENVDQHTDEQTEKDSSSDTENEKGDKSEENSKETEHTSEESEADNPGDGTESEENEISQEGESKENH